MALRADSHHFCTDFDHFYPNFTLHKNSIFINEDYIKYLHREFQVRDYAYGLVRRVFVQHTGSTG